ncbi:hypothetical protein [Microbacterium sp.]|uniref:hypothetical protein n=1 Tax=Microbacterium sp. TaxID=51671 RepID=UPI003F96F7EF
MTAHYDQLRAWARGMQPLEAATELLIRTGGAEPHFPWILHDGTQDSPWVAFDDIPDAIGAYSGGEQRILRIAASLGSDSPVVLGDEISGLDCDSLRLVLAAVAHASGQHEAGKTVELVDDKPRFVAIDPLYTWPAT